MATIQERIEQFVQTVQNMSSLAPHFLYDVGKLLNALGYEMQEGDDWLLGFCVQTAEAKIKNNCNIDIIPNELKELAVRLSVGEFFKAKKGIGALQGFEIDLSAVASSIKEGDTTVSLSGATPEQRLDILIDSFTRFDNIQLARFRRLVW